MKRDKQNYLDFIPVKNPALPWRCEESGIVVLEIEHRGAADRIAQKFFGRPKKSSIKMDAFGSFIWQQADGVRNIYEIGQEVKHQFGEDAEPLYERLVMFMRTLAEQKYISYKK